MLLEFIAEFCDVGLDRPGCRIREDTDGFSFHVTSDGEEIDKVLRSPLPCSNAIHDAMNPPGSLAAR